MIEINKAKQLLGGSISLAVVNGDKVFTSELRGVNALLNLLDNDKDCILRGGSVADKIVGKAAALLMCYGKVNAVYAEVLSETAAKVFENNKIEYSFGKMTANIINRSGDDICPMEQSVKNIDNPLFALTAIKNKLAEMRSK